MATITVNLHITSCATNAGIPYATISDNETGESSPCNASGNLTFQWDDTYYSQYFITASAANYDSAMNIQLVPQMDHTTQTFCLNPVPPGGPPPSKGSSCFIATAAYGSPIAPEVQELRAFRDDILCGMQWGKEFFDDYWRYYHQFSPALAEAMEADPRMREIVRWSIVEPWMYFLRAVIRRPDWSTVDFDSLQPQLRDFLLDMRANMDRWLSEIHLPANFAGMSNSAIVDELNVILSYVVRGRGTEYLDNLAQGHVLPLQVSDDNERQQLLDLLRQSGRTPEEMTVIIGSSLKEHG